MRRALPLAATILSGLVLILLAVSLAVATTNHIFALQDVPTVVLIAATAVVGVVVAWHLPANPMGWLLLGLGGFMMLSVEGTIWLTLDYRMHHGRLPLGGLALLVQPAWGPAIVLFGLIILLFPDGRLPSRRWRWLLGCYLATAAVWLVGAW
jgi:hypothetical protein